jgi:hypothetical protein
MRGFATWIITAIAIAACFAVGLREQTVRNTQSSPGQKCFARTIRPQLA